MTYGYCRCSTSEELQDVERQIRLLTDSGVERANIFFEYIKGDAAVKPEFEKLMATVRPGDTIRVTELSRLSRSTKQVCELADRVKDLRICLDIMGSMHIDCTSGSIDPMTQAFLQIAAAFAELEKGMIRERVKTGMANAKEKGIHCGRYQTTVDTIPEDFMKAYRRFKDKKIATVSDLAKIAGVSRQTCYKYMALIEA